MYGELLQEARALCELGYQRSGFCREIVLWVVSRDIADCIQIRPLSGAVSGFPLFLEIHVDPCLYHFIYDHFPVIFALGM